MDKGKLIGIGLAIVVLILASSYFLGVPFVLGGATTLSVSSVQINSAIQYIITLAVNGGSDSTEAYIQDQVNSQLSSENQIINSILIRYQLKKENCGYKAVAYSVPKLKRVEKVKTYYNTISVVQLLNLFDCIGRSPNAFYLDDWGTTDYCYDMIDRYGVNYLHSPFIEAEVGLIASNDKGIRGMATVSNTLKSAELKTDAGQSIGRIDWAGTMLNVNLCPSESNWYAVQKDAVWRLVDKSKVNNAISSQQNFKQSLPSPISWLTNIPIYGPGTYDYINTHNNKVDGATESIILTSYGINQIVEATGSQFRIEKEDLFSPLIALTLNKEFVGVKVVREYGKPSIYNCRLSQSKIYIDSQFYALFDLKNIGTQNGSFSVSVDCSNNVSDGYKDYGQIAPNAVINGQIGLSGNTEGAFSCTLIARDREPSIPTSTCNVSGSLVKPVVVPTCNPPWEYDPTTNSCVCLLMPPEGFYVDYANCKLVQIPAACTLQPKENEELVNPESSSCYLRCKEGYHYEFNVCVKDVIPPLECPAGTHQLTYEKYNFTVNGIPIPIISDLFGKTTITECVPDVTIIDWITTAVLVVLLLVALVVVFLLLKKYKVIK